MQCWYCKKAIMEDDKALGSGWKRCPKCEATWIKDIKLAKPAKLPQPLSWEEGGINRRGK